MRPPLILSVMLTAFENNARRRIFDPNREEAREGWGKQSNEGFVKYRQGSLIKNDAKGVTCATHKRDEKCTKVSTFVHTSQAA